MVMTTEVLRNMLYSGSSTLTGLGFVVMDEVHYLADRFRGAVWEEVIIHLPESVALVSLSATVSNAEEFGEWLETVRGETTTIVEERRPVPLYQHVMVGRKVYDLFKDDDVRRPAQVNPDLMRIARDDWRAARTRDHRSKRNAPRGRAGARGQGPAAAVRARAATTWSSGSTRQGLLPAIIFVFSRVGCDAAVTQCLNANLKLTIPEEREEIRAFVEDRCRNIPDEDLHVLGYHDFLEGLTRGVAAHHAGMLPTFKECVEELFTARPVPGRVRHRDAGARHQHAGPLRGDREAVEVERRDARRHHAGGVHPAHRPRRPPRHRRRGPRRGAVAAGVRPQGGRRPRLDAHLPAQVVVPPVVQHGGQPRAPGRPGHRTRAAGVVVRAVPGRQGGRRARPTAAQGRERRWRGTPRRPPATSATSWSTPGCAVGSPTPRPPRPRASGPTTATRWSRRWRRCAPAT